MAQKFLIAYLLAFLGLFSLSLACWGSHAPNFGVMTEDTQLLVGSTLVLNCSLLNAVVNVKKVTYSVNSSMLAFKRSSGSKTYIPFENVHILDSNTAQLRIENSTEMDSGLYFCFLRVPHTTDSFVCTTQVSIGFLPEPVTDFKCISMHFVNLTCHWKPQPNRVKTTYTLSLHMFSALLSSQFNRMCPNNTATSCQWGAGTNPPYDKRIRNFTFILNGTNALGFNEQVFNIDHFTIVLPNHPTEIRTFEIKKHNISIEWKPPKEMMIMNELPPPLLYQLQYISKTDLSNSERWNEIDVGENVTSFTLTNLVPFTQYDIRLRCRSSHAVGENMWSIFTYISATTLPDVPYMVPEIISEAFEVHLIQDNRSISLHWKPVPVEYHNGEGFTYVIGYTTRNDSYVPDVFMNVSETSETFQNLESSANYNFFIWSSNIIGQSENYSFISVANSESLSPTPHEITAIAHGPRHYELSWKPPENDTLVNYTIFWCSNLKPWLSGCEGPIQWLRVNSSQHNMVFNLSDENTNFKFAVATVSPYSSSGMKWASCIVPSKAALSKIRQVYIEPKSSTSFTVIWQLDCDAQKAVVYKFQIIFCKVLHDQDHCKGQQVIDVMDPETKSYTVNGLVPFTRYRVVMRTYTKAGKVSEDSDRKFATTHSGAPSDPPERINVRSHGDTAVFLSWEPPTIPNGIVTHYIIHYDGRNTRTVHAESNRTSYTVEQKDLLYYTNYSIQLEACVNNNCSPLSEAHLIRTGIGVPGEMDPPRTEVINASVVRVSWNSPLPANGPVDSYRLYYKLIKENETESRELVVEGTETSTLVLLTCPQEQNDLTYLFSIQAINIKKDGNPLYGPMSAPSQTTACFDSFESFVEYSMIVGLAVGGSFGLAGLVVILYLLIRWMKKKVDTVKNIEVKLPSGLEYPDVNPMNSYETFKNGVFRKSSDPHYVLKTVSGQTDSQTEDKIEYKNRHGSGSSHNSSSSTDELIYKKSGRCTTFGRNPSGDSSGCSSGGHDSISSCHTTRTQLSVDSGTEVDFPPPSPDVFHKIPLPSVLEACDSDSHRMCSEIVKTENQESKLVSIGENLLPDRSLQCGLVLGIQQPYSKFGITHNKDSNRQYLKFGHNLSFYSRNLANSEPSVLDLERSSNEIQEMGIPYSKVGLAKSVGDVTNSLTESELNNGYCKFGMIGSRDNCFNKSSCPSKVYDVTKHGYITVGMITEQPRTIPNIQNNKGIEHPESRYKNNSSGAGQQGYVSVAKVPSILLSGNGNADETSYSKFGIWPNNVHKESAAYISLDHAMDMPCTESQEPAETKICSQPLLDIPKCSFSKEELQSEVSCSVINSVGVDENQSSNSNQLFNSINSLGKDFPAFCTISENDQHVSKFGDTVFTVKTTEDIHVPVDQDFLIPDCTDFCDSNVDIVPQPLSVDKESKNCYQSDYILPPVDYSGNFICDYETAVKDCASYNDISDAGSDNKSNLLLHNSSFSSPQSQILFQSLDIPQKLGNSLADSVSLSSSSSSSSCTAHQDNSSCSSSNSGDASLQQVLLMCNADVKNGYMPHRAVPYSSSAISPTNKCEDSIETMCTNKRTMYCSDCSSNSSSSVSLNELSDIPASNPRHEGTNVPLSTGASYGYVPPYKGIPQGEKGCALDNNGCLDDFIVYKESPKILEKNSFGISDGLVVNVQPCSNVKVYEV